MMPASSTLLILSARSGVGRRTVGSELPFRQVGARRDGPRTRYDSTRVSYLYVDGEQTQTTVALLDEDGTELRAWKAEPLTTPSKPAALEDLRRVVRGITEELHTILADSGDSPPKAACFSLRGYMHDNDLVPSLVRSYKKRPGPREEAGPRSEAEASRRFSNCPLAP